MAGHSKFKNIMHRKGAQDQKRAKLFTKITREITVAAAGGLADPNFNPRLRLALIAAREANLPKERIEVAIKKATANADFSAYDEIRYEGYGSCGVALIVEALSDNRNRTAAEIRSAFTKFGGTLAETGSVSYMFNRIGVMSYPLSSGSIEDMLSLAIDAQAEDCEVAEQEYEICCSFDHFTETREYLEKALGEPLSAKLIWRPSVWNPASHEVSRSVLKLIEALEDLDDVRNVWTNLEIPDDFEEES